MNDIKKTGFKYNDMYVTVAERVAEFRKQYPEGAIRIENKPDIVDIGNGSVFVRVQAKVYRDLLDDKPAGIGWAWKPVPGPTPFTQDSELQNAETAAVGRALVWALAVDTKKGIASKEEILARRGVKDFGGVTEAKAMIDLAKDDVEKLRGFYIEAQERGADKIALAMLMNAGELLSQKSLPKGNANE